MSEILKVIGLMSGTSLDGVDAALIRTDGLDTVRLGPGLTLPYEEDTRALMRAALDAARDAVKTEPPPPPIHEAETVLTRLHAEAVRTLLAKAGLAAPDIALIGFHGQTILHRPERHRTWQIGDGAMLARLTGIDVVNDFRSHDVAAGGQGAPLVPLYHAALARQTALAQPVAVVNIGGVANLTYINGDLVLGFDTGPGNAAIDDWMAAHTGKPVDQDGAFAATGRVNETALAAMLAHPFFRRPPPKSLDRMDFGMEAVKTLSPQDGAATLTAFTAAAIAKAREYFMEPANTWIICGGGRHNMTLMRNLKDRLDAPVITAEEAGWNGDTLEAEAFAYLAVRSVKGLPLSLPTTTGVKFPMTGGKLHRKP